MRRYGFLALLAVFVVPHAALAADTSNSFLDETPISAGAAHSCGVEVDGHLACWGDDSFGQTDAPDGAFLSVASGSAHSCGIRADGTLACWGSDSAGQLTDIPSGQFVTVSAGGNHTCAIRVDGTLACWGRSSRSYWYYRWAQRPRMTPSGQFVAVSTGRSHSCGIRADGTLACWGSDWAGQLSGIPSGRFRAVSAGGTHTCAIRGDGTLACWGSDWAGQLSGIPSGRFRAVSAGGTHTCAIRGDGTLACWGSDWAGQLSGIPSGRFRAVSAGGTHTCAIDTGGATICWGSDLPGQPTADPPAATLGPIPLAVGNDSNYNCILQSDGRPSCWGADSLGAPLQAAPATESLAVSGEARRACVLDAGGEPQCWGSELLDWGPPSTGQFQALSSSAADSCAIRLDGTLSCWGVPSLLLSPPPGTFRAVSGGKDYACAIRTDGSLACWGGTGSNVVTDVPAGSFRAVTTGDDRACGLRDDGILACWGANDSGDVDPVPSGPARAVVSGASGLCAVLSEGELSCWEGGEPVGSPSGTFYSLGAGADHTCGVRTSGTLTCFGNNDYGQTRVQLDERELPQAILGTPYSHRIEATPSDPAPEFAVSGGNLPDGLQLSRDGTLSGSATKAGEYAFVLTLSNGVGDESEEEVTIEVVGAPLATTQPAQEVAAETATLKGSVDPENLPAEAWFEYWPASGSSQNAVSTPVQAIAKGVGPVDVSAPVGGLVTATEYAFRLSARNGLGAEPVRGDTMSFTPSLPPPVAGQNFNLETVEGTVKTKCASESSFNGLVRAEQVPTDCLIDTTRGTVRITLDKGAGETQTADFWGGLFRVNQNAGVNQTAVMKLAGQLRCERRTNRGGRVQRRSGGGGRKLWGSGKGNYKTVGSHGAATVQGTIWLVQDRCDGATLVKVRHGTVSVDDFVKDIQVIVQEGEQYLIEPPTARLSK